MLRVDGAVRGELLSASDETIEDAIAHADPMVLRGLLYQLTAEAGLARMPVKRAVAGFLSVTVPERDEDVALLRAKAAAFLKAYRDRGAGEIAIGPPERLPVSLGLTAGEDLNPEELGLWLEELALDRWERELRWRQAPPRERLDGFSVTIVGAGMGGLTAAVHLKRAGIPFRVIEKNSGVGGTWFENRYPGCRVDSPSRCYTNIFGAGFAHQSPFCAWTDNAAYFNWVADTHGLREHILFETEVRALTWDEDAAMWAIEIETSAGRRILRSQAVITAVGFLNRPKLPEIDGMADFRGRSWHTARWPADIDPRGTRFAVIGTGCSGYQLIPELALEAGHVTVFQRTPQWLFDVPGYRSPFREQVTWLDRNLPYHVNFMRFRTAYAIESVGALTDIDPDFADPHAISATNKRAREGCIAFLERKLGDPALVTMMTPPHPVFAARPVIVDSDYSVLDALQRDNVTLVTAGIRAINATGIESRDGVQHGVDAIVYATGFHATDYLYPMKITGRDGRTIEELWSEGGARAYRFCMMPGIPNLWSLYGPNSNGGLNVPALHELMTLFAMQCLERLILDGKRTVEPNLGAYWTYNRLVDELNARKSWSDPRTLSYYQEPEHGRTGVMNPFRGGEVWRLLRHPTFDDLEIR